MHDPYNTFIEYQGRKYRYDPDMDCFYAYTESTQSRWDQWGWILVTLVLAIIAWAVSQ